MNRENKRKSFEKGYYRVHACNETFTCKLCGRRARAAATETTARTA